MDMGLKFDLYAFRQSLKVWNELVPFGMLHWAKFFAHCNPFAPDVAFLEACLKDSPKPLWGIREVVCDGETHPVSEEEVVDTTFCRFVRFAQEGREGLPRVLVVAPLAGHYSTLLRETVQSFLKDHDVYVTDWKNARDIPAHLGPFSLDNYIEYERAFFRTLAERGAFHVVAVCQPTVPTIVAVSLEAQDGSDVSRNIKSLTLIGGPVDARCNPTQVNTLATQHSLSWFRENMIHRVPGDYLGRGRDVYPGFIGLMNFINVDRSRHEQEYRDHLTTLLRPLPNRPLPEDTEKHRKFYAEFNAVMDLPAEYYLETVANVFQQFSLARGVWRGNDQVLVEPRAITETALFTIEGAKDSIAGIGQTEAAHKLLTSVRSEARDHYLAPGGHYSVFSGSHFRNVIYGKIRDFIEKHTNV